MGHKAAGCLDSIFWASITIGRLGFIFVSYRFSAPRLLTFSLVGRFDPEVTRDGLEAGEPAQGSIQRSWMCEHGSNASALQTSLRRDFETAAPTVQMQGSCRGLISEQLSCEALAGFPWSFLRCFTGLTRVHTQLLWD